MNYTPPADLLIHLGFVPSGEDHWFYPLPSHIPGDTYHLSVKNNDATGLTEIWGWGANSDRIMARKLYDSHFRNVAPLLARLVMYGWRIPDTFADQDAFYDFLLLKGYY